MYLLLIYEVGYISASVGWSLCQQDYSKIYGWIYVKYLGKMWPFDKKQVVRSLDCVKSQYRKTTDIGMHMPLGIALYSWLLSSWDVHLDVLIKLSLELAEADGNDVSVSRNGQLGITLYDIVKYKAIFNLSADAIFAQAIILFSIWWHFCTFKPCLSR